MNDKTNNESNEAIEVAATVSLLDTANFASPEFSQHQVELPAGVATVHVAELTDKQLRDILGNKSGYDRAELISMAIRDAKGKRVFTQEQAGKLKPKVALALESVAMKANGYGGEGGEGNAAG